MRRVPLLLRAPLLPLLLRYTATGFVFPHPVLSSRCAEGTRHMTASSAAASSEQQQQPAPLPVAEGDGEAFMRIVKARCAAKYFLPDPIPESVVREVLAATLRAPSSFNFQPWACVIVRSAAQKDALAPAMLGHNATRMKIAPLTAIFCADVTPSARADAVRRNHAAAGLASSVSDNIVKLMQGYSGDDGSGGVDGARARGTEAWAFKMTGFAAQTYLLGMAAHGIATAPMEGFDAEAVSAALSIPKRFKPIVAIVTGYDDPEKRPAKPSWRFTPNEMFYQDTFGEPVPGLEP